MDIFERTASALKTLSIPYALGQYITGGGDLPDLFITFFEVVSGPELHADDVEHQRLYWMQISIWSRTGLVSLPDTDTAMLAANFTLGPEHELPYDQATRHFGLAREYFYLENFRQ